MSATGPLVASVDEALARVGLPAGVPIKQLTPTQWEAFEQLIGWREGGPVVAAPTPAERALRQGRHDWKQSRRAGGDRRLLLSEQALRGARQRVGTHAAAADFARRLRVRAEAVAAVGDRRLCALIPEHAPWNAAGSFCPHCLGARSTAAIHAPFWRWRVETPDRIQCPHCDIVYPHADYVEHGLLHLPRMGITYAYYLSPAQRAGDPRDGVEASRFGGGPTHVSLSGEADRCALNWLLGQIEPLALAAALFDEPEWGRLVGSLLERLAQVMPVYPLYSYRQEYADCDPAFAVEHLDALPTPFKRAACRSSYCGQLGRQSDLHGLGDNTTSVCHLPNGEWGAARLAREKASHGQLFLTLMQAYDLVRPWVPAETRRRIETDLLLEYYLDVVGLTRRIDNKSGPGAAARVAYGVVFDDPEAIDEGVDRFESILHDQFYDDGSWRETPIYGAKALVEGLWQIPELMTGRRDLYAEGLMAQASRTYAETATPLNTLPALDDSAVDFGLPPHLVDLAQLRLKVTVPLAPTDLSGLRSTAPQKRSGFYGYVPRWEMACVDEEDRLPGDGGLGFLAVGHQTRPQPAASWVQHLLGDDPAPATSRPALNRFYRGRGLACIGFGTGSQAVQAYLDGGDGGSKHRHLAPLQLTLFADGLEIFPDLGYVADHPANAWIRTTASHNSAVIDGHPLRATGRCHLHAFTAESTTAVVHVENEMASADGVTRRGQRRLSLYVGDGWPLAVVDELRIEGPGRIDHVMRVNADPDDFAADRSWEPLSPPWDLPFDPPHRWQLGGPVEVGDRWHWEVAGGRVLAVALTPSPSLMRFRAPAWRTHAEIGAAPAAGWESVVLHQPVGMAIRILYLIGLVNRVHIDIVGDRIDLRREHDTQSIPLPSQL